MSHTIPKKPDQSTKGMLKAAHDAASADGAVLHRLSNVVRLAAFACEAQRTLEGIESVLTHQPKAKKAVSKQVRASASWSEIDDVTGEVLLDVAEQLAALNESISGRPFELQKLAGIRDE